MWLTYSPRFTHPIALVIDAAHEGHRPLTALKLKVQMTMRAKSEEEKMMELLLTAIDVAMIRETPNLHASQNALQLCVAVEKAR